MTREEIAEGQRLLDDEPNVRKYGNTPTTMNAWFVSHGPELLAMAKRLLEMEAARCVHCGHTEPHNGPAGDIPDACTHPMCNCGFDSRGDTR